jgi:hypothetical protein
MLRRLGALSALALTAALLAAPHPATGSTGTPRGGIDVRLTNDDPALSGYVSAYTLATGQDYTDATLDECSIARGRQNEPSVGVDPRNQNVLIGSSNDYCGVYSPPGNPETGSALGPVWLGYYRSEDGGQSFVSSLVPGYPNDTSPFKALAHVRTASSGDPVIAWDGDGRVFMGSESSGDPEQPNKENGDVWVARYANPDGPAGDPQNDGLAYEGTQTVGVGSAAFNGKFNDKTAIEADRTDSSCRGNVYFSWSRFTGDGSNGYNASVYFSRSTDHGVTWSKPMKLSQTVHDIQFPDISVTGNGHVYVTFREFKSVRSNQSEDAIWYVKSTNCGASFGVPAMITTFEPYDAVDIADPEPIPIPEGRPATVIKPRKAQTAGSCGDFSAHCASGYTFFRITTQVRGTADQTDTDHEYVYLAYDPSKPGTEVDSGTTYGTIVSGDMPAKFHQEVGSQQAVYFIRLDGATGQSTSPALIDDEAVGHQRFPDISIDGGVLHAIWWDSRLDPSYSPARPVGNDALGSVGPSLDVWSARSNDLGQTWVALQRRTDVTSNPNYEQFSNRASPFAGDYLWVTSLGEFAFVVWTDYRDTVQGSDPREITEDEDDGTADVHQCRTFDPNTGSWSGDTCPHEGGIDQNLYGDGAT